MDVAIVALGEFLIRLIFNVTIGLGFQSKNQMEQAPYIAATYGTFHSVNKPEEDTFSSRGIFGFDVGYQVMPQKNTFKIMPELSYRNLKFEDLDQVDQTDQVVSGGVRIAWGLFTAKGGYAVHKNSLVGGKVNHGVMGALGLQFQFRIGALFFDFPYYKREKTKDYITGFEGGLRISF